MPYSKSKNVEITEEFKQDVLSLKEVILFDIQKYFPKLKTKDLIELTCDFDGGDIDNDIFVDDINIEVLTEDEERLIILPCDLINGRTDELKQDRDIPVLEFDFYSEFEDTRKVIVQYYKKYEYDHERYLNLFLYTYLFEPIHISFE